MVTIDLTRVNRISPYSLVASNRPLFYELITDTGIALSMNLTGEEGIPNYAAIITRKDNPDLPFISKQFRVMEELLREKPE